MKKYAVILKADGPIEKVELTAPVTLEQIQAWVGGNFETVMTKPDIIGKDILVLCNEDGKLAGLPTNGKATTVADIYPGDYIAGDAVLLKADGEELVGISEDDLQIGENEN